MSAAGWNDKQLTQRSQLLVKLMKWALAGTDSRHYAAMVGAVSLTDAMSLSPLPSLVVDPHGQVLAANSLLCALLALPADSWAWEVGTRLGSSLPPAETGDGPVPALVPTANGSWRAVHVWQRLDNHGARLLVLVPVRGGAQKNSPGLAMSGSPDIGSASSVTDELYPDAEHRAARAATAARAAELAMATLHDQVTGLHNRAGLLALAENMDAEEFSAWAELDTGNSLSSTEPRHNDDLAFQGMAAAIKRHGWPGVAVLVGDLDGFTKLNRIHGQRVGDAVLKAIGNRLRTVLREEDLVARVGADEFAVVLPNVVNHAAMERVRRRLRGAVAEPIVIDGTTHRLCITLAAAYDPAAGVTVLLLLERAESALAGRHRRSG